MKVPYNVLSHAGRAVFAPADARGGFTLERKDDSGADEKKKAEAKAPDSVKEFMEAWGTFREKNDARLGEIEKKLDADPLYDQELKRINTTLDKYEAQSQKLAKAEDVKKAVEELEAKFDHFETVLKRTGGGTETKADKLQAAADWAVAAVKAIANNSYADLSDEQKSALFQPVEEMKALNIGTNTAGGYLAPIELVREIIKDVTEISPVRSLARVRQTSNRAIEIPKRTGRLQGAWVEGEQGTKSAQGDPSYGMIDINTHEFYALVDLTNWMLEDAMFNMLEEVRMETAETFAELEGAAFVNGTGVGQPEGFMTNADVGETFSGAATTIADADGQANGILTMKYLLKTAYTRNAQFVLNRTTIGSVRKLKDSQKNYIWMPGIAQGRPNLIDGDPYTEMPDMPNEGAGLYPIAYGDFRRAYTWVDRIQMEMLRDPYTQATGGKVRYIMRKRVGGRVIQAEAIKKLKCATS